MLRSHILQTNTVELGLCFEYTYGLYDKSGKVTRLSIYGTEILLHHRAIQQIINLGQNQFSRSVYQFWLPFTIKIVSKILY